MSEREVRRPRLGHSLRQSFSTSYRLNSRHYNASQQRSEVHTHLSTLELKTLRMQQMTYTYSRGRNPLKWEQQFVWQPKDIFSVKSFA